MPFSIRPVSAKQHADSNWLETLITGPAPQRLIGRGFPQEWGCLCAHVCGSEKELTANCVRSGGRCQDQAENTYCSIWEISTQEWYICIITGFKCFSSGHLSNAHKSQVLLCTISYSVSLGFLIEQPQSYQGTYKTCFINSCHVFSSKFATINELECVFWRTVRFLLIQSELNSRRRWWHYTRPLVSHVIESRKTGLYLGRDLWKRGFSPFWLWRRPRCTFPATSSRIIPFLPPTPQNNSVRLDWSIQNGSLHWQWCNKQAFVEIFERSCAPQTGLARHALSLLKQYINYKSGTCQAGCFYMLHVFWTSNQLL